MELSFKWQKILLIHFLNLATKNQISQIVHRFSLNDVTNLVESLEHDIGNDLENNTEHIYIVSLVPIYHQFKLPNYIIKKFNDLKGISCFVDNNSDKDYKEIWYFKKKPCQACGRILFSGNFPDGQCIEIIDGDTVRNVETGQYNMYFMAERIDWGWSFKVKRTYFSENKKETYHYCKQIMSKVFTCLELQRDRIEILNAFLSKLGLKEFSLDFLLTNNDFLIIDWDTGNDMKVLNFLKSFNFEKWNDYYTEMN